MAGHGRSVHEGGIYFISIYMCIWVVLPVSSEDIAYLRAWFAPRNSVIDKWNNFIY